ncbi:double C2-like domain-containing protein gamma isoform X2 [Meriones unguiculatus]|uniref:double C2-like domain-containing protein gamma isoform X2 n=1 Tax=Meriones unguiculatus TaxID=10047 RepID=UPI00293E81EC|nr:double C2-like domain-containing protein gamma isoform X2 [Meriones unguiculatus]
MACAGPAGGRQRVSMQEHMAIDVSPGPIRPIRLISDYFPHFYPFLEPVLRAPDPRAVLAPAVCSVPQLQPDSEPEADSDDSTVLGTLEFTLLFDADNSALHCTAHCAKGLKPPASGSVDTYVKANLLPGASKASQLRTRTVRGTRAPVWEETLTYHGFTCEDAGRKTLRLCVCEDSRLRRRRHAPPLGELRVPLRKLVPNRARSFDICLEKRRLTKRPKILDTARGMSLYEESRRPRARVQLCPNTLYWQSTPSILSTANDWKVWISAINSTPKVGKKACFPRPSSRLWGLQCLRMWQMVFQAVGVEVGLKGGGGGRGLWRGTWAHPTVPVLQLRARWPAGPSQPISPSSFLHPSSGKKSKYKTSVRRKTLNPEFNEEFFYAGHREELAQKALLVSVWDYDLGTADDFIGGVQLSGRANGECLRHWRECLGRCDRRLEVWHLLDSVPPTGD